MTKFVTLILCTLLAYFQYQLWLEPSGIRQMLSLKHAIAKQIIANQTLEARNQGLEAEIEDLKTGRAAIEERARSDLGMVKQGETFYQIIQSSPSSISHS